MPNIHATTVAYKSRAVLITGASGAGKSDLALRLIIRHGAVLIADDRTDVAFTDGKLGVSVPEKIAGFLEVRGIGILKMPYQPSGVAALVVELVDDSHKIERLPTPEFCEIEGVKLPLLKLCAFEASASDKIVIKIDSLLD